MELSLFCVYLQSKWLNSSSSKTNNHLSAFSNSMSEKGPRSHFYSFNPESSSCKTLLIYYTFLDRKWTVDFVASTIIKISGCLRVRNRLLKQPHDLYVNDLKVSVVSFCQNFLLCHIFVSNFISKHKPPKMAVFYLTLGNDKPFLF